MKPIVEVTAVTHRKSPIYLAGMTGMPTTDDHVLKQIPIEASYYQALKVRFPEVKAVHVPNCGGAHYLLIVSMNKRLAVESRSLIAAAFGLMGLKLIIVVDDDVDISNMEKVLWAVLMRSQPDQDVIIIPRMYRGQVSRDHRGAGGGSSAGFLTLASESRAVRRQFVKTKLMHDIFVLQLAQNL